MQISDENLITDIVIKALGLEVCADTFVGNAMLRGISGGQKKRVTVGEAAPPAVRLAATRVCAAPAAAAAAAAVAPLNPADLSRWRSVHSERCCAAGEMVVAPMKTLFADEVRHRAKAAWGLLTASRGAGQAVAALRH